MLIQWQEDCLTFCRNGDQWVLQTISQGYALPFLSSPPVSAGPVETPLPVSSLKREALWTEVQSLLDKGAVEELILGKEGLGFDTLLPGHQKDRQFLPNPKSKRIESLSPRRKIQDGNAGLRSLRSSKIYIDISGSEGCIPSCFHCASTQTIPEVCVERSMGISPHLPVESSAFWPSNGPQRLFTKLLAPVAAHLHLGTMSMYPYIDDIFHAQMSQELVSATKDASVRLHLRVGFIINLAKSSLVPSQGWFT